MGVFFQDFRVTCSSRDLLGKNRVGRMEVKNLHLFDQREVPAEGGLGDNSIRDDVSASKFDDNFYLNVLQGENL